MQQNVFSCGSHIQRTAFLPSLLVETNAVRILREQVSKRSCSNSYSAQCPFCHPSSAAVSLAPYRWVTEVNRYCTNLTGLEAFV